MNQQDAIGNLGKDMSTGRNTKEKTSFSSGFEYNDKIIYILTHASALFPIQRQHDMESINCYFRLNLPLNF